MIKQFISQYLSFTKKERNGTLVLLVLIIALIILPFLFPLLIKKKEFDHASFKKEIATLTVKQADTTARHSRKNDEEETPPFYQPSERNYSSNPEKTGTLFYFDPNTLDEAGWQKLGLRDKTIATIKNYLSKGGKFKQPEDIKKIWGLNEALAERLVSYVKIATTVYEKNDAVSNYTKPVYEKPIYKPTTVDINMADTSALIALPGIGSKLAQRIITFRDKLGGFYNIQQVGETFGLPDSTFQKIKPSLLLANTTLKQININTATLDELKSHPYLRYAIANAIVQYRSQHGNFNATSELKKIAIVTDEIFAKAAPYLKIN